MKRVFSILLPALLVGCAFDADEQNGGVNSYSAVESFETAISADEDYALGYRNDYLKFEHFYNEEYSYWGGFAHSKCFDMEDGTPNNQYGVYNTKAASGNSFLVYYYDSYNEPCDILCHYRGDYQFTTVRLNLTTYTYKSITDEDVNTFARAFTDGDYLKVIFTALLGDGSEGESVDCYVVDYRDGKRFVATNWDAFDISALRGELTGLRVRIETTDVGEYGANTPLYICMDDLTYTINFM
ncbi:MAG: DUF4465 domain-containing protein [Alistipes sp.]|nr:DUF4465 domain-containing protein [Alistipes sp.]